MMAHKHTPGPISFYKCTCGHRACNQYTLSSQGSVGFEEADARLYAAAPELLAALESALWMIEAHEGKSDEADAIYDAARAAIAKATGAA